MKCQYGIWTHTLYELLNCWKQNQLPSPLSLNTFSQHQSLKSPQRYKVIKLLLHLFPHLFPHQSCFTFCTVSAFSLLFSIEVAWDFGMGFGRWRVTQGITQGSPVPPTYLTTYAGNLIYFYCTRCFPFPNSYWPLNPIPFFPSPKGSHSHLSTSIAHRSRTPDCRELHNKVIYHIRETRRYSTI